MRRLSRAAGTTAYQTFVPRFSLATSTDGAVCVCDLVEPVGKSQPTVSHHLKVLREAGLVASEKRGTNVWYAVVPAALESLCRVLGPVDGRG